MVNAMNNEKISALMDDEIDGQVIKQLQSDDELKSTWSRYHLIGDCLGDSLPEAIDLDLANKVRLRLQDEAVVITPDFSRKAFLKPVVGFAIAASVATVAVFGIKQSNQSDFSLATGQVAAVKMTNKSTTAQHNVNFEFDNSPQYRTATFQTDTSDLTENHRMSGYLINHNEYRKNGMSAIRPYVRIVTIESQEK